MKYGKRLRDEVERTFPDWRGEFISYKQLKKQLNLTDPNKRALKRPYKRPRITIADILDAGRFNFNFSLLLNHELEKVNRFYVDKEEDYIIRLKELQNRESNLECSNEKMNLQKDILDFHAEMVLLLHYSVLNSTGFLKIVKKHNKRAGTSIQLSFIPRVLEQPFVSTDLLYNLLSECEDMLQRLFLGKEP